jgi:hypothetical protein
VRKFLTIGLTGHLSHYCDVPFTKSSTPRLWALWVAVCVVAMTLTVSGGTPASAGVAGGTQDSVAHSHKALALGSDHVFNGARHRRAGYAWPGRTIRYTESLPSKWDWSLATAIGKWNSSGGGIRFVKTARARQARLNIGYGDLGRAAGMASVGRSRHAWVRLSSGYSQRDASDAHNRVEVMAVLAHELGHVLGFEHTSAPCSLMSAVMDVEGCGLLPPNRAGYYRCRTIDPALAAQFVRLYGGRVRYPAPWCLIDALPSKATGVVAEDDQGLLRVRWAKPAYAPVGSLMRISTWPGEGCGPVPAIAQVQFAAVGAEQWRASSAQTGGSVCVSVQLVNRYGAGQLAVARVLRF